MRKIAVVLTIGICLTVLIIAGYPGLGDAATIYGCYNNKTEVLKVEPGPGQCSKAETELSWDSVGPQGPQGLTGPQGPQGLAGAAGATGAAGPQGPIGLTGATGPQGLQGLKGDTGAQGPKGDTGATGPQGLIGLTGPTGPAGAAGATGAQGLTWQGPWNIATTYALNDAVSFNGSSYVSLSDANLGNSPSKACKVSPAGGYLPPCYWELLAQMGDMGPQGDTGPQGPAGAIGPQGAAGATGTQGPTGLTGATGPAGPQGAQGLQGPTGVSGPQGPIGLTGARGATGPTGPAGAIPSDILQTYCQYSLDPNLCLITRKTVFVTSETYTGNLGGGSGADAICQSLAAAAGLLGQFRAWISYYDGPVVTSQTDVDPASTFNQTSLPYYLLDGREVAADWSGLTSGNLLAAINVTENGTVVSPSNLWVWTGTNPDGTYTTNEIPPPNSPNPGKCVTGPAFLAWTDSTTAWYNATFGGCYYGSFPYNGCGGVGSTAAADFHWSNSGAIQCNGQAHLYCFQQ